MSIIQGANIRGANVLGRFTAFPNEFASLGMDLDFLDTGSITLDGSNNIETILDLTSQNRDFTQATPSLRPAFITNVGAQFVDDFLEHTTNFITDSAGTIMLVVRFDRLNTIEYFFSQGDSAVLDGNAWEFIKNPSTSNNIRSQLTVGTTPGIGSSLAITDTSTFRVVTIQKNNIYINSMAQDLVLYGSAPTERWFNSVPVNNRIAIGRSAGSQATRFGRVTLKRVSYFNQELSNQDIIKLVNGLRLYYNF